MIGLLATISEVQKIQRGVNVYYDFTKLTQSNGGTIATVDDIRNNKDGTGVNTPTCEVISYNGDAIKSFKDETNKCFNLGNCQSLFDASFECWFVFSTTDGQMA